MTPLYRRTQPGVLLVTMLLLGIATTGAIWLWSGRHLVPAIMAAAAAIPEDPETLTGGTAGDKVITGDVESVPPAGLDTLRQVLQAQGATVLRPPPVLGKRTRLWQQPGWLDPSLLHRSVREFANLTRRAQAPGQLRAMVGLTAQAPYMLPAQAVAQTLEQGPVLSR